MTGLVRTSESESAMNETPITIVGNVISDVKARRTTDGQRMVSFRVASNERRYDKDSGEWVDGDRFYVTVICWRRLANGVALSLAKGDPVIVTGRLYTRGYEVEGQKKSVTEVAATAVGPDLARCCAELARQPRTALEELAKVESGGVPVVPEQSRKAEPGHPRDGGQPGARSSVVTADVSS